ncbi:hypothetical protein SAY87_025215 [Trapa incisa]|uniref:RING-CH-type domain-containing protein n=2 Tax=Trapa TaxID=22665 RepID=A0AAN7R4S3_TRANT|nr:hypothetical protein SAY87_025215 [Trapa incisa]KAK4788180.1 hypothetical protein SAY86_019499 [Trapa natans]
MEDVALIIDELRWSTAIAHCRICHEAEFESSQSLEAPCACSGTVKFAHRDCIQRWCNEKGNTICEICLQSYEPGYTAISKKKPPPVVEEAMTIRVDSAQVGTGNHQPGTPLSDGEMDGSDYYACTSAADRGAAFCRSFALTFTGFLILRHVLDVLEGKPDQYPFTLVTVLVLRITGIIIPMFVLARTITAFHNMIHNRYLDARRGAYDEDEGDDSEDQGEEEEEEENDRQRHHIV